ncbi:MAG: C-terminal peptidase prc, partial [Kiritimatiellia bacterium]
MRALGRQREETELRLWPKILLFSALLNAVPANSGLSPDAYGWVVNLVESLYLHQDRVQAPPLIKAAATGLADKVHWLIVDTEGDVIYLRHGNGTKLGSLSVTSMEGLPKGLQTLEEMVVSSGYSLDGVDVRLAILQGMTSGLDRYSTILSGDRLDRFDVRLKGTYVSIGATVSIQADKLVVQQVDADGPAHRAKLMAGDLLLRIDGTSTVNMPVREADRRLRGDAGSHVSLIVRRDGVVLEVSVAREEVVVPNVSHRVLTGNVGYVRISHFSQRTTQNLSTALRALTALGALDHGLVIDLRNNTGGSMKDSARSADLFVENGMLLRTAGHDGRSVKNLQEHMQARVQDEAPNIPLAILTNGRTASGSEIMAGALVQLDRAALVGSRSFGKGTVQKIYRINNARLKLTVARYLLHDNRQITVDGLAPDLAVSDIRLDSNGMRFVGWSEDITGARRDQVLGVVAEHRSWRGENVESSDMRIEVARRAVSRATSPSRAAVLEALLVAATEIRAEQEEQLVRALAARDIDWTTDLPPSDDPPLAQVL